jgi:hypothetical protein
LAGRISCALSTAGQVVLSDDNNHRHSRKTNRAGRALARQPIKPDNASGYPFLPAALLFAAQRAFIIWESFLRPLGVRPPLLRLAAELEFFVPAFLFAHRALAAAASFARVCGDMRRRDPFPLITVEAPRRSELSLLCNRSICRRIDTACSRFRSDRSMEQATTSSISLCNY